MHFQEATASIHSPTPSMHAACMNSFVERENGAERCLSAFFGFFVRENSIRAEISVIYISPFIAPNIHKLFAQANFFGFEFHVHQLHNNAVKDQHLNSVC